MTRDPHDTAAAGSERPVPRRVVALQSLANPVRLNLLERLSLSSEPLSSRDLASAVPAARRGIQSHMRQLQEGGWVRHVDGEGRNARWVREPPKPTWSEEEERAGDTEAIMLAAEQLDRVVRGRRTGREEQWVKERQQDVWPVRWRQASISHDYLLHLTADELEDLEVQLREVLDRFARAEGGGRENPPEGAEVVFLTLSAFPMSDE